MFGLAPLLPSRLAEEALDEHDDDHGAPGARHHLPNPNLLPLLVTLARVSD